jgi:histidinol-phosphatase (PHP family)
MVKKQDMIVEMNTAGLRKYVKEPYPESSILKMIIERDIPMVLSSDSHKPEEIGYNFQESFEILRNLGLKMLCKFTKRQKELIKI